MTQQHMARMLNAITVDDCRVWLAEHGVDIGEVVSATVRVDRDSGREGIGAWLDVEFYLLDSDGGRFPDLIRGRVATGTATIPLRSWPKLTPVSAS